MIFTLQFCEISHNYYIGLYGEYACRRLDAEPVQFGTITTDTNGITNHMDIIESRTGS